MSFIRDWTAKDRRVAIWSALGTFFFGVLYAPTLVAAFVSAGNVKDPFLGVLEVQIILMAPLMVVTMVAVHGYTPRGAGMYSLSALGFMIPCADVTTGVHFVELTVARRIYPESIPGYSRIFSWEWPSILYALDILAWDWFFGLSMLLAVPVFSGGGKLHTAVRACLILSGTGGASRVASLGPLFGVFVCGVAFPSRVTSKFLTARVSM